MPLFRRLATLATAAEAARRYARKNPDKAGKFVDQAAAFVDKQTKGKYSGQIGGATRKVKGVAGIPATPGLDPTANGNYDRGFSKGGYGDGGYGSPTGYPATPTPPSAAPIVPPNPPPPSPGPSRP